MSKLIITLLTLALSFPLWAADTVDINTADATQLAEALNGIGQAKAQAIVAYRDEHGAFEDADQLVNVKGIGLATVNRNREVIIINEASAQ